MKRTLGQFICIENENPNPPDRYPEIEPFFDVERGYQKGDVFNVTLDDDDPAEKYPYTLTGGFEYKKYPGQLFEVKWKISKDSFKKHFVSLRKAKLATLNAIWDAGPDN